MAGGGPSLREIDVFRRALEAKGAPRDAIRRAILRELFLAIVEERGLLPAFCSSASFPSPDFDLGHVRERIRSFSGLSSETLGRVHEFFVGLSGHRKAAGVFYTPSNVVDYIVEHTLGAASANVKILDPACGAGAFLVAAYRKLLEQRVLDIEARAKLLVSSIHGIDLDPEAVEITKWRLWLELFRDEKDPDFDLPNLDENIRCGDGLEGEFSAPFDVVLGNPPYGGPKDLYVSFLERYASFLRTGGLLGVVVSNTWLQSVTLRRVRAHLASHYRWLRVLLLPANVFRAVVDTHVLVFRKVDPPLPEDGEVVVEALRGEAIVRRHVLFQSEIPRSGDPINVAAPREAHRLFRKILSKARPLSSFCDVYNGVKPFETGKGSPPQTPEIVKSQPYVREGAAPDPSWSPLLRGSLVRPYGLSWNHDYWIKYGPWLAAPRAPAIFSAPKKIMVRQTGDSLVATLVGPGFVARNNLHVVLPREKSPDLRYVLGVIASRLMDFVYSMQNPEKGEALAEVKKHHVEALPIAIAPPHLEAEVVARVDEMLALCAEKPDPKDPRIAALRAQIDAAVFEIYGLSAGEIGLVERASSF